ncbi:MAG TPA: UDP-N-acetylmuramate--L-alanine ligase [Gammaproteobacteria bacterium]|nr:UDP-N-acetylmuramate--L-alanine ligase [Gammaproteobacteria bacterium]
MEQVRRVHFVGIGGSGMGGIAEVLHTLGFVVSGSDRQANAMTRHLAGLGLQVHIGHDPALVVDADVVVTSTAVLSDNPEVQEARRRRVPLVRRAEMLAELMRFRFGVAIAGTHGKTTTTSLVASVLAEGGLDPTFVIGGRLNSTGSHARLGAGRYLVAEADESDASFLLLAPMLAVVTNIDHDHLETYGGDPRRLLHAFREFVLRLPFYGLAVVCADDPGNRELILDLPRRVITYGIDGPWDLRASDIQQERGRTRFRLHAGDVDGLPVELALPGLHNVRNALATIAVAREIGVATADWQQAVARFQGIARRFHNYGEVTVAGHRVLLIDDYAHHPREIAAVLEACRSGWPGRRVVALFQPHRYSRTRDLLDDFALVLSECDRVLIAEVYAAGEPPIAGADARGLARALRGRGRVEPILIPELDDAEVPLATALTDGDILLVLGAGSVGHLAPRLVQATLPSQLAGGAQ